MGLHFLWIMAKNYWCLIVVEGLDQDAMSKQPQKTGLFVISFLGHASIEFLPYFLEKIWRSSRKLSTFSTFVSTESPAVSRVRSGCSGAS